MRLERECGSVANGESEETLVVVPRTHAWQVHSTDLAADIILAIANARNGARGVSSPLTTTSPSTAGVARSAHQQPGTPAPPRPAPMVAYPTIHTPLMNAGRWDTPAGRMCDVLGRG